jgi:hypothetical protein
LKPIALAGRYAGCSRRHNGGPYPPYGVGGHFVIDANAKKKKATRRVAIFFLIHWWAVVGSNH